ncbi:hypothetical protein G4228_017408 [Cervus hanglu yarkandensis]|nr:hypothetical protein G4228_017408 [Cervus hanglu yarkandensis]
MPREDRATWKSNYFLKIIQLLDDYPKCFIVGADNVAAPAAAAAAPAKVEAEEELGEDMGFGLFD